MRVLIVEDESRMAKRCHNIVIQFFKEELLSCKVAHDIENGLEYMENHPIDLLLLDLNLNGKSGFDMFKIAVSKPFHTIIVSAHRNQAITAFEHGVLDFVPKPYPRERLFQALQRFVSQNRNLEGQLKFLTIRSKGMRLIPLNDILYIKGAGTYTELILRNGKTVLHDKSLERLSQLLPETFERIHKSYLVKLAEIEQFLASTGSKYQVELKNGQILPVGRTRYKVLKKKWLN